MPQDLEIREVIVCMRYAGSRNYLADPRKATIKSRGRDDEATDRSRTGGNIDLLICILVGRVPWVPLSVVYQQLSKHPYRSLCRVDAASSR